MEACGQQQGPSALAQPGKLRETCINAHAWNCTGLPESPGGRAPHTSTARRQSWIWCTHWVCVTINSWTARPSSSRGQTTSRAEHARLVPWSPLGRGHRPQARAVFDSNLWPGQGCLNVRKPKVSPEPWLGPWALGVDGARVERQTSKSFPPSPAPKKTWSRPGLEQNSISIKLQPTVCLDLLFGRRATVLLGKVTCVTGCPRKEWAG
jgi:hypothetical protein